MPDKRQLGIFWGEQSLFFVETLGTSPKKFFSVPIMQDSAIVQENTLAPKGINLASLIGNAFRKQNIDLTSVNLSLPTKDIIFRTFIIPWMQSHELKGVVSFEASKYIPFALEDLSYTFHPITINEAGTRRIRIILVALKKSTLDNYISTLEQSNLSVDLIEPSFLSLIRTLIAANAFSVTQTIGIFEKRNTSGEIIIINRGIPQFVREFPLPTPKEGGENAGEDVTRLINEIRISLDYFNRQENELRVEQILFLSSTDSESMSKDLEADLGIPIKPISIQSILGNTRVNEPDYIDAFGIGLSETVETPVSFDFARKKTSGTKMKVSSMKKVANFQSIAITFVICLSLNIFMWIFTKGFVAAPEKEISSLRQQLGSYEAATADKMKETNTGLKTKLEAYKKVVLQRNFSLMLNSLPQVLPQGVWLKNIELVDLPVPGASTGPNLQLDIGGFAYSENVNVEIQLVTKLQDNIQNNKVFSKFFEKNVRMEDAKAQKMDEHNVVYFRLKCQTKQ